MKLHIHRKDKKKMKKLRQLVVTLMLVLAFGTTVMAEPKTESYKEVGVDITLPDEITNAAGYFEGSAMGAIDSDHHVYALCFIYLGSDKDVVAHAIANPDSFSEEELEKLGETETIMTAVFATDKDLETVRSAYEGGLGQEYPMNFDAAEKVGSADGYDFYAVPFAAEEFLTSLGESFAEEYHKISVSLLEALKSAKFYAPVDKDKEMLGKKLEFTTTDLDGNTVTSAELFANNKITMVNCWGTWCPPCVGEMSTLADMHTRLQEKGCGIVGLDWEKTEDPEAYVNTKAALEEYGTNYPVVKMPKELTENVTGFPTTYFVDQEGNILSVPIAGAYVEGYEPAIDALLAGEEAAVPEITTDKDQELVGEGYNIIVKDSDGPVEGVTVQFCDDTTCNFGQTDSTGTVHFDMPGGKVYEVHILMVPDGYVKDETVYHTAEDSGELTIEIAKQ